jgi:hypothetical protein
MQYVMCDLEMKLLHILKNKNTIIIDIFKIRDVKYLRSEEIPFVFLRLFYQI